MERGWDGERGAAAPGPGATWGSASRERGRGWGAGAAGSGPGAAVGSGSGGAGERAGDRQGPGAADRAPRSATRRLVRATTGLSRWHRPRWGGGRRETPATRVRVGSTATGGSGGGAVGRGRQPGAPGPGSRRPGCVRHLGSRLRGAGRAPRSRPLQQRAWAPATHGHVRRYRFRRQLCRSVRPHGTGRQTRGSTGRPRRGLLALGVTLPTARLAWLVPGIFGAVQGCYPGSIPGLLWQKTDSSAALTKLPGGTFTSSCRRELIFPATFSSVY